MTKLSLALIVVFGSLPVFAVSMTEVGALRNQALQSLNQFNPAEQLKGFNSNPNETHLNPQERSDSLKEAGLSGLKSNEAAREVYQQSDTRTRISTNPTSDEMRFAETLLNSADDLTNGTCYLRLEHCEITRVESVCEEQASYDSFNKLSGSCITYLNQGCLQVASVCQKHGAQGCELFSQTFRCIKKTCTPAQTICMDKAACVNGQCDSSQVEVSNDIKEGLPRLGALAGVAGDVSTNQMSSGSPSIFIGSNLQCRTVVAGIGNCCGGSARFLHCRDEEKELALAKEEGRAYTIGKYCARRRVGMCIEEKESWCVFNSKLASIVQIQGRLQQLRISFGLARGRVNQPNCRGIMPEELERINFSLLKLAPIEKDLIDKMAPPQSSAMQTRGNAQVERLNEEGVPHA